MSRLLELHQRGVRSYTLKEGIDDTTKQLIEANYMSGNTLDSNAESAAVVYDRARRKTDGTAKGRKSMGRKATIALGSVDITKLETFDFNVLAFTKDELEPIIVHIYERFGVLEKFNIKTRTLRFFIREIRREYLNNLYHNFFHAVDVMHCVYRYMNMINAHKHLSYVDILGVLTAGFAHDVGHVSAVCERVDIILSWPVTQVSLYTMGMPTTISRASIMVTSFRPAMSSL